MSSQLIHFIYNFCVFWHHLSSRSSCSQMFRRPFIAI